MPEIIKAYGYHIYFWSNENEPLEYIHIHISKKPHQNATKYWLLRDGSLEEENNNDNIPVNDLKRIIRLLKRREQYDAICQKWLEHFETISFIR